MNARLNFLDPSWQCKHKEHTSIPGKGVTSEPVATRMFLVLIVVLPPSLFLTMTWFGVTIVPWPWTDVIPFFLKSPAIPRVDLQILRWKQLKCLVHWSYKKWSSEAKRHTITTNYFMLQMEINLQLMLTHYFLWPSSLQGDQLQRYRFLSLYQQTHAEIINII